MSDERKYISGTEDDLNTLTGLPVETLKKFLATHIRNIWRVDGLYFLGIEKRHGTDAATEVDIECWRYMGGLEARDLAKMFSIEEKNLDALEKTLPFTSWYLDHPKKRTTRTAEALTFEVIECRTQKTRIKKSLPVFPCRPVREGYLSKFAEAFNCECKCEVCPPGERDGQVWCRWKFVEKA